MITATQNNNIIIITPTTANNNNNNNNIPTLTTVATKIAILTVAQLDSIPTVFYTH